MKLTTQIYLVNALHKQVRSDISHMRDGGKGCVLTPELFLDVRKKEKLF